ncbi:glycosyltransferase family 39 protein [Nocardioides lijunqiniae]|uniref:glycosyltransferase family 39 protein n=1 Tax=Nocardioides lijunqiniae TaxID=2760832 RepID=UPI001878C5CF|nr:glycosyltransferase family 39 protein [Nocardioides lijunqiniae]
MTITAPTRAPAATTSPDSPSGSPPGSRLRRLRRIGPERGAYVVLLAATAVLYLWGLGASGYANAFYSAAAQAGSESWTAMFFGASDAAGSITVDKPPLALWPMALSVRVFGLSSWSILVPQALAGVATVALLTATVRRTTGSAWAGILAGATLALTPVAALMFRFNNPDALLVLLMVGAAHATLRAVEGVHPARWLALGGALVGLAFLTKMLQAFLVLPALALAYGLFATVPLWRRLGHLLVALAALVASTAWYVAIVELWPAGSRPYIGGSQDDSILELTLGYNGLGRLTGEETGSVGGGGGWGSTGVLRLFGSENGGQVAWLVPAALVLGVAALWLARRGSRATRASLTLWLTWLVVTMLTFSLMAGIYHAYYTVALAPAIGALVGTGAWALWDRRDSLVVSATLGVATALTSAWAFFLLDRTPDWLPWLRYVVATVGLAAALMVVGVRHLPRRVAAVVAAAALVSALAGPAAYSLATVGTAHTGSIPTAGPSTGGPGGMGGMGGMGGAGGLLAGSTSTDALTAMLLDDADSYTWVAATVGANSAAGYQLATERSVMPLGGFNGSDPSPTLAQFQQHVADGEVHYFVGGGGMGMGGQDGGSQAAAEISAWVAATYPAQTVDGVTVYDLTRAG